MLCRVAALKRLPLHDHSADYIFWLFGIIGLILSQFENRVPLKPVRGDVGRVEPLQGEELYKRLAFVLIPFVLYTILYVCMLQSTK